MICGIWDKRNIPFFLLICAWTYKYTRAMITLEAMYSPRTMLRTSGFSKSTFLETCIIPRMMTRLELNGSPSVSTHGALGGGGN